MNRKTILFLLLAGQLSFLQAQSGIQATLVGSGFSSPVAMAQLDAPGLFIIEKRGIVKFFDPESESPAEVIMDIRDKVRSSGFEQGLLGLAFHPQFPDSNYLFVNYIISNGDSRVSRFTVDLSPDLAVNTATERQIITIGQPYENHNGGDLAFGPDGMLYIAIGDGGDGGDPEEAGQDRLTLLGKILRLDIDSGNPYAIPDDNPFANEDFTLDEIWALGLRNPWRISFDRQTGDLWIGDVGQGRREEINRQVSSSTGGENYGWDCFEGELTFESEDCPDVDDLTFPVFSYGHGGGNGCSVTGGFVYRGNGMPERQGQYFLADWCSGRMWALAPDGDGGYTEEVILETNSSITTFGEDHTGELYYATGNGSIFRLESTVTSIEDPRLDLEWSVSPNPVDEQALISLQISEPENVRFSMWDFQGRLIRSWEEVVLSRYNTQLFVGDLPSGNYSLVVQLGNNRYSRMIHKN